MNLKVLIICSIVLVVCSCNTRKNQERDADRRLANIEQLVAKQSYQAAKMAIDSIHKLYPRLINKRKAAAVYSDTILRRENGRNIEFCSKMLPIKEHELDSLMKDFSFEKNQKYEDVGNYIHKILQTGGNLNRTYLKAYVDENANIFIISTYCGNKINHHLLEMAVKEEFVKTDTVNVDNANFYSFDDAGTHWETLTFKNEKVKNLVDFIAKNLDKSIKIKLIGDKNKSYVYYLTSGDKKAIIETFHFYLVKKDIVGLEKQIKKSKSIIARLCKTVL